ncbi:MAG: sulfatase-like hydrolase/transferase, partial [Verrucomicrobiales bacterium]|nr:sulfatase-like hydrolase/transferase [Verrucomicrobiales bacterium]
DYQFSRPSTGEIWDQNGSKAHWKNRKKGQPFFAVFNYTGCHESGIASQGKYRAVTGKLKPEQRQDPAKLDTLPPYYPDTPVVREDWKRNYELITAMDAWAGSLIKEIKDAGLYEETIIFFWADHGVGLPRAKRWLYGSGTHIPLIVRVPGKEGGQIDTQLVSSVDLGPTVLNLAGIEVPDKLQGRAFIGEKLSAPRRFVFGARDRMDERYDIIRSIFDGRYRYIRNFEPLKPYHQYMNTPEKGATMREIRRAEKEGTLTQTGKIFSTDKKPVEELYDYKSDPHEIRNLASDPDHSIILKKMRSNLAQWQSEIGDIGLIPEAEIEIREKKAGSRFEIMNGELSDKNQVQRLVSIATKASQGNSALGELISAITDNDPVIRYWALTGIGNIGVAEDEVLELSKKAMKDESPNVRIAAARAVARLGDTDSALEVLRKELRSDHQWGRLAAAIVIDEMGEPGRKVVKDLKEVLSTRQPNKYILRVANRALNDLLGTENRVP